MSSISEIKQSDSPVDSQNVTQSVALSDSPSDSPNSVPLITVKFVEGEEAHEIMLSSDRYFDIMTPFDRAIRMNSSRTDITREEFGRYATSHTMKWEDEEKETVTEFVNDIAKVLTELGFKGKFPNPVKMIKTDGLEDIRECAGYCRKNTICINRRALWNVNYRFLTHELFHIFSQNNPELRDELYNSIGFFRCNEIELPDDVRQKTLTNPDAPNHDVYIDLTLNESQIRVTPVLFYNRDATGSFFSKLYIKMLEVEKKLETDSHTLVLVNGQPVMHDVDEFTDFYKKIGESHYYFHPDEILATRFADYYNYRRNSDPYMVLMGKIIFANPPVPDAE